MPIKNMLLRNLNLEIGRILQDQKSCGFEPWLRLVFHTVAFSQLCNAEAFNIGLENCPPSPFIGNWDRPGFGILVCFFVNTLSIESGF